MSGMWMRLPRSRGLLLVMAVIGVLGAVTASTASGSPRHATHASSASVSGVSYAKAQVAHYEALQTRFATPGPALKNVKAKVAHKVIWYIPVFLQAPIFSLVDHLLQGTFAPLHATVHVCDADYSPTAVAACFHQAIASKAGGIITDSFDDSFDPTGYLDAFKAHIPIVASNDTTTKGLPVGKLVTASSGNQREEARLEADWVIANSNGKANVLYAVDQSPDGYAVAAATAGEFKAHCPACTVTNVAYTDNAPQNTPSAISSAMESHPAVNYVLCPFDSPAGAYVLQGAQAVTGRKYTFVCDAGNPPGLDRVKAGTQAVDIGTDPVEQSWIATDAMLRMMTGSPAGAYGDDAIRIFTSKDVPANPNSTTAWASGRWYTNLGYMAAYRKLWGEK